jgi:L-ascorbate metabolism protein UlaG (beta-lactamase superfamily)
MSTARSSSLTFIGTATTLLRLGPFTVLTDPNFLHRGERAYLGWGLSSKRLTDPAMEVAALPELDAVVLSHLHGDHWDRVARAGLPKLVTILTTPHAAIRLRTRRRGFTRARGLKTWQSHELGKDGWSLTVTSLPGRHASGPLRLVLPPVMGSLLTLTDPQGATVRTVYISGDTLVFDGVREIARRHPGIDVSIVHLGGTTLPGGFVVTMDGEAGVEFCDIVRPRVAIPVHYDDYGVFTSPLSDFTAAAERRGLPVEIREVRRGQTVALD